MAELHPPLTSNFSNFTENDVDLCWVEYSVSISLSFLILITNSLAFIVYFCLVLSNSSCGAMTFCILALSQAVFGVTVICENSLQIVLNKGCTHYSRGIQYTSTLELIEYEIFLIMITFTNCNVFFRNWWIVLLSSLRCASVLRPTKMRVYVNKRLIWILFVVLLSLSVVLSTVRTILEFVYNSAVHPTIHAVMFAVQSGVPPVLVAVLTAVLLVALCRQTYDAPLDDQDEHTVTLRTRRLTKVTKMVLLIAISFALLETPNFLTILFYPSDFIMDKVMNLLVTLDYGCTFFFSYCANKDFRMGFRKIFMH